MLLIDHINTFVKPARIHFGIQFTDSYAVCFSRRRMYKFRIHSIGFADNTNMTNLAAVLISIKNQYIANFKIFRRFSCSYWFIFLWSMRQIYIKIFKYIRNKTWAIKTYRRISTGIALSFTVKTFCIFKNGIAIQRNRNYLWLGHRQWRNTILRLKRKSKKHKYENRLEFFKHIFCF